MATITKRRWDDGRTTFLAVVRVTGFKTTCKTFEKKAEAAEWADSLEKELRAQRKRGAVREDVSRLTIGGLVREYLADDRTKALRSFEDSERLLAWWVNKYGNVKIVDFGPDLLLKARTELAHGRSPGTVNRYVGAMRSCWNWGINLRLIAWERAWPKRIMLKEPRGRVRYLSDAEIGAVLKAAETDPVMYAAIVVSIATGVRQGELLRLQWSDLVLDSQKGTLSVRESKNDTPRTVHLPANAVEALQKLKKATVVSPVHVFLNADARPFRKSLLEHRWRAIRKAAKLSDFRWHDLRHTCASILIQNGASLPMVGSVLGHKSASMTMRYSHLVQGAPVVGHDELNKKLGAQAEK